MDDLFIMYGNMIAADSLTTYGDKAWSAQFKRNIQVSAPRVSEWRMIQSYSQ